MRCVFGVLAVRKIDVCENASLCVCVWGGVGGGGVSHM